MVSMRRTRTSYKNESIWRQVGEQVSTAAILVLVVVVLCFCQQSCAFQLVRQHGFRLDPSGRIFNELMTGSRQWSKTASKSDLPTTLRLVGVRHRTGRTTKSTALKAATSVSMSVPVNGDAMGSTSRAVDPPSTRTTVTSSSSTTTATTKTSSSGTFESSTSSSSSNNNNSNNNPTQLRVVGDWEELHGNFMLRPSLEEGPPRALIHFLGGAIVGAAPHLSYRYLLERLAAKGYLIVATPYNLSFDHLKTCDAIIARFERIGALLAQTYGALPVVGVGHSCGSLLQLLITSLFPDTPRAANALIAFNNKPVQEAVPLFEEAVAPFFTYVAARNQTNNGNLPPRSSGSEIITVGLHLAKATALGQLPSDALLTKAAKLLMVPPIAVQVPSGSYTMPNEGSFPFFSWPSQKINAPDSSDDVGATSSSMYDSIGGDTSDDDVFQVKIPVAVRDAFESLTAPTTSALVKTGTTTLVTEFLDALQQIPLLIDEVADGARDFVPSPNQVKAAARRSYRARCTLLLQYNDDPLDESDQLEELLRAAAQVIAMKRPMIEIDVQRRNLLGGHVAPLLAPPLDLATRAETLLGEQTAKETLRYVNADATVNELIRWLEACNL